MNKKIVIQYTILTFLITYFFWGGLLACAQFGITLDEYPILYVPQFIGLWTPAIASFIVLRKNQEVSGMKEWLKNILAFRTSVYHYGFVVVMLVILIVLLIATSGLNRVDPVYMFFVWMLGSLVAGAGAEESGWRYILQTELNKKFGYVLSCLIIAPVHIAWHVPLWLSLENGPLGVTSYWSAIFIFGLTFTIGAIHKISGGNVFLCLLFHCMVNAGASTFIPNQTLTGAAVTSLLMMIISIVAVFIHGRLKER